MIRVFLVALLSGAGLVAGHVARAADAALPSLSTPLFVLNSKDADVSVIDPATWKETKRIPTGKEPHHLYMTPDEKSLIIANAFGDSLTFIDPRTAEVQRTVTGTLDPYQLRFSPDMQWFVTLGNRLNHVDIYRWDGENLTLVKRIPSRRTPSHVWISADSRIAYATMQDSSELVAIDLPAQKLLWRIKTGNLPADVFGTPDGKYLLIGLTGATGVEVYDVSHISANPDANENTPPKLKLTIATGEGSHSFRALGDGRHVLVSNRVENTISKIDYAELKAVDKFPGPSGPDDMDVTADMRYILLSSRWAGKMSIIDMQTKKVVRQVNVGKSPHGIWTLEHAPRQ